MFFSFFFFDFFFPCVNNNSNKKDLKSLDIYDCSFGDHHFISKKICIYIYLKSWWWWDDDNIYIYIYNAHGHGGLLSITDSLALITRVVLGLFFFFLAPWG